MSLSGRSCRRHLCRRSSQSRGCPKSIPSRPGRGMVTIGEFPPVTLGISSRQPSGKTSCRARSSGHRRAAHRGTVRRCRYRRRSSCQASCAAVNDTATRPPRPGGNACTNASVTSRSAMQREQGHRADRKGLVRCHTGQPRTARSAEPRGKHITKAPQKAVERHLCRARDTGEERADRRHAHGTAGSSPRRAQTCRLRKESDRRHAEEGWTRPQPGGERWLLPDPINVERALWTRAPCLRSQLRCSLSMPPQASDPRVLAPRRPGATGRRQRGHERRRGADAQACSRCHLTLPPGVPPV